MVLPIGHPPFMVAVQDQLIIHLQEHSHLHLQLEHRHLHHHHPIGHRTLKGAVSIQPHLLLRLIGCHHLEGIQVAVILA